MSVMRQTCKDVEVVVLDNHSTDDTSAMLAELMASDARIKHVRHERNIGMVPNFNAIRDRITGDYFSVLTDDDEYETCFVETALKCFVKGGSVRFVACNAPTRAGDVVIKSQMNYWREGFCKANTAVAKCILGHYPLVTNCLFEYGLRDDFAFREELKNTGDGFLLSCMFSKYDAYICKTITGYWNNDGENASSLQGYDPVLLVDAAIQFSLLYRDFCRGNGIRMRHATLVMMKKYLTILAAADRSGFDHVRAHSMMKDRVGVFPTAILRLFHWLRIVRLSMQALQMYRRTHIAWTGSRER